MMEYWLPQLYLRIKPLQNDACFRVHQFLYISNHRLIHVDGIKQLRKYMFILYKYPQTHTLVPLWSHTLTENAASHCDPFLLGLQSVFLECYFETQYGWEEVNPVSFDRITFRVAKINPLLKSMHSMNTIIHASSHTFIWSDHSARESPSSFHQGYYRIRKVPHTHTHFVICTTPSEWDALC